MNEHTMNVIGPTLAKNGYWLCPINPGKKACYERGWEKLRMTPEKCEDWPHHNAGVGILCGVEQNPICAIDVDVPGDEELASHMQSFISFMVGWAPVRIGKAPKFLMMFRAAEANWGKTSTNVFKKDDRKVQLEVLGRGNQFVAYHIHPDTGLPYEWPEAEQGLSPEFMPAWELPEITLEQVEMIKAEFARVARELGYTDSGNGGSDIRMVNDTDLMTALTPPKPPVPGITIDKARKILKDLSFDLGEDSYNQWLDIGMALHHQFEGSEEGLRLWDELSAEFPESYKEKATEKKWNGFKSNHGNAKTFQTYLRMWEKQCNPDYTRPDELGLLYRFLFEFGEHLAFFPKSKTLCAYDEKSGHWTTASARAVVLSYFRPYVGKEAKEIVEKLGEEDKYAKAIVNTARKIGAHQAAAENRVIQMVQDTLSIHRHRSEFDSNPRLFGVGNGVVDLDTGVLLPNAPELRVLRRSDVTYDPSAKCPTWERVVYQCMGDDAEMAGFLKRLFGSALTGNPIEDKVAMLRGLGCNGKSVFTNTMRRVFGDYAEIVGEETIIGKSGAKGGQARSDVVALEGARLAVCAETSEMARLNEADVKRMSGGDEISARGLYAREAIRFKTSWLLCVATNHMPEIKGDDDGIWRRVADIEFPRNFDTDPTVKKDPMIEDKIERELPGVLNWLIEGLHEYQQKGLRIPKKVELGVQQYREDSNDVARWANYRLIPEEGKRVYLSECYDNFRCQMQSEGQRNDLSQQAFSQRLRKFLQAQSTDGEKSVIYKTRGKAAIRNYRLAQASDFEEIDPFE